MSQSVWYMMDGCLQSRETLQRAELPGEPGVLRDSAVFKYLLL